MKRGIKTALLGTMLALGLVGPAAPRAMADPPHHAPAYGYRARYNEHHYLWRNYRRDRRLRLEERREARRRWRIIAHKRHEQFRHWHRDRDRW
jgi:hypothetical protein